MILKYIACFLLLSGLFGAWYVLVMYVREMNKRLRRAETLVNGIREQLASKAEADDKHIVSLAMEIMELKDRFEYAEQIIGYKYPEKRKPEC